MVGQEDWPELPDVVGGRGAKAVAAFLLEVRARESENVIPESEDFQKSVILAQ